MGCNHDIWQQVCLAAGDSIKACFCLNLLYSRIWLSPQYLPLTFVTLWSPWSTTTIVLSLRHPLTGAPNKPQSSRFTSITWPSCLLVVCLVGVIRPSLLSYILTYSILEDSPSFILLLRLLRQFLIDYLRDTIQSLYLLYSYNFLLYLISLFPRVYNKSI
jgi:hypothetical protein